MPTVPVGGGNNNPVKIVDKADPPGVIFNRSITTQLLWGTSAANANRQDASILDPNAVLAVNEDAEVWMVSATPSVQVLVDYHPNGIAFFRGLTTSGGTLLGPIKITDPSGTDFIALVPGHPPTIQISTGDAAEITPGLIVSSIGGSGPLRRLITELSAPVVAGQNAAAFAEILLNSPSVNLATQASITTLVADVGANNFSRVDISPARIHLESPFVEIMATNLIAIPAAFQEARIFKSQQGEIDMQSPLKNNASDTPAKLALLSAQQTGAFPVVQAVGSNFVTDGAATFKGNVDLPTIGSGLAVAEGANAKQGTATLVAGTVTVANTSVTANSRIMMTAQDGNSTGSLRISARTAGTSFVITSSNAADHGVVAFEIFEPG